MYEPLFRPMGMAYRETSLSRAESDVDHTRLCVLARKA